MVRGTERNIAVAVILSIITCGIYNAYWIYILSKEAQEFSGEKSMAPGVELLLCLVTCGIYYFYWNYKYGQLIDKCQEQAGIVPKNNSVLYLILSLLSLGIVSQAIMQYDLNEIWKTQG